VVNKLALMDIMPAPTLPNRDLGSTPQSYLLILKHLLASFLIFGFHILHF
jgi:hypothetical protein